MADIIYWAIFVLAAAILLLLWWVHVWAVMRDITREDAREIADRLFEEYVNSCEYRVHIRTRIVDETRKAVTLDVRNRLQNPDGAGADQAGKLQAVRGGCDGQKNV